MKRSTQRRGGAEAQRKMAHAGFLCASAPLRLCVKPLGRLDVLPPAFMGGAIR